MRDDKRIGGTERKTPTATAMDGKKRERAATERRVRKGGDKGETKNGGQKAQRAREESAIDKPKGADVGKTRRRRTNWGKKTKRRETKAQEKRRGAGAIKGASQGTRQKRRRPRPLCAGRSASNADGDARSTPQTVVSTRVRGGVERSCPHSTILRALHAPRRLAPAPLPAAGRRAQASRGLPVRPRPSPEHAPMSPSPAALRRPAPCPPRGSQPRRRRRGRAPARARPAPRSRPKIRRRRARRTL